MSTDPARSAPDHVLQWTWAADGVALGVVDALRTAARGCIGHLVAEVAEPALADLTWPARIGVNAYLGVPITSTSTRMYL